jgi:hypothetical protein
MSVCKALQDLWLTARSLWALIAMVAGTDD